MAATMSHWRRWRWQGAQCLRGMGLPGGVGLALALGCVLGFLGLIQPMQSDAQRLEADSDALSQRAAAQVAAAPEAPATPQQQLLAFEQRFAGERSIAPSLARLQAAAQRRGFTLEQAEFKLANEATEPLMRYTIGLPVKAEYRALRRFSRDALRELPGLALDEVSLRRGDPKSPQLEAQLRFVLFLAKPTAASAAGAAGTARQPVALVN